MPSTPYRLPVLLALLSSMFCASCTFPGFVGMNAVPHNGHRVTQTANLIRRPLHLTSLPEGDVVIMHMASDDNIHIQRLDDSLDIVFQYTTPPGDMEQKPLALIRHKDMLMLFAGEYDGNDSMYVVLRHLAAADGTERKRDTIVRSKKKVSPYLRTEFGIAASPDSSKVLIYNFDLTLARAIPPLPTFADATLLDLTSGTSRSMRFEVTMPISLQQAGYNDYAPSRLLYHAMPANDGRTYFTFPGPTFQSPNDSLAITYVNFERQTSNTIMTSPRNSPCVWEKPRFCRPHALIDFNGDLLLASIDYTGENKLMGVSVARFSGKSPSIDQVKHHRIDPAAIAESSLENAPEKFITIAMVPNPDTRGYTFLFQREKQERYIAVYRMGSDHDYAERFLYGDIYAIAFDAAGERVWEKTLIQNKMGITERWGPHVIAEQAGDSLVVNYLGMTAQDEISIKSAKFSQRTGTGSRTDSSAVIATVGTHAYVDLTRSFFYNDRNSVLFVNGMRSDEPRLVRVH